MLSTYLSSRHSDKLIWVQDLAAEAKEVIADQDVRIRSLEQQLQAAHDKGRADADEQARLTQAHEEELQRLQQQLDSARFDFADLLQESLHKMDQKLERAFAQEASTDAL